MGLHGKAVAGHPNLQYWGPNEFIRARVWVPLELRATIGKTLLVKGLGTQCVAEAVRRSHEPLAVFQRMVDAARSPTFMLDTPSPRYLELEGVRTAHRVTHMMQDLNPPAPVETMQLAPFTYEAGIREWIAAKGTEPPADTTISVYRSHLSRFFGWLAHDEMGRVTEQNIIDYPDVLLAGADGGKRLVNKSVNNNMATIGAVFGVAKRKKKIATDPTENNVHKLPVPKKSDRLGFDREQHAEIVRKALQSDDPVIRWHWSLNAFWGARIGEIADAKVSAVRTIGKHAVFEISRAHRVGGLALKTAESARILPIHSVPLRAGFLAYVAERRALVGPDGPLFDLPVNRFGMRSHAASGRCMAWLRDVVGISDPNLVFHSSRHTIKTFIGGKVSDRVHNAITGHLSGDVSGTYGETEIADMARAIEKIRVAA